MATTTTMYKGATSKADLVLVLQERNQPEEVSRPLKKLRNKEIVEAAKSVEKVYQQILETEDDAEAAEDMKGASQRTGADLLAQLTPKNIPRYI
jgi:hypothetical protein